MKVGDMITIVSSNELSELRLQELCGKKGMVMEKLSHSTRKNKGYMVKLDKPFKNYSIWFIPSKSVICD